MWKFDITELPSGLRVASRTMPGLESVSVGVWTTIGSRFESLPLHGAAHFIEHLVFKGTKTRSAKVISNEVEGRGGYLNAVTGEESTCYYARARGSELPLLVDVLGDIYMNAVLDPVEVERERGVIREEILMYDEQPAVVAHEHLNLSLWPGDPVGRAITGTLKSVQKITREQLQKFRQNMYSSKNTWLVAAGNVAHEQLVACVLQTFGTWQGAPRPPKIRILPHRKTLNKALTTDADQTQLAVGFRGLHRTHPDRYALRILNVILGENMSSRLFQKLREDRGWAYSIGSHIQLFQGTGSVIIQAGVEASKWKPALDILLQECQRLATKRISPAELKRAREYAIGSTWLALESASDVMFWMGESLVAFGNIIDPMIPEQRLANVTADQVRRVAARLFSSASRAVVVSGPQVNECDLYERLSLYN